MLGSAGRTGCGEDIVVRYWETAALEVLGDSTDAAGIVGVYKGSQAREVLITPDQWQALREQEAEQLRSAVLEGDDVPDMIYDDDM